MSPRKSDRLTDRHRRMAAEPLDVAAYRAALDPDKLEGGDWRLIEAIARVVVAEAEGVTGIHPAARWPEVLPLVAEGMTDREIAAAMGIGEETVNSHLDRAFRRLGARNRAHLVALGIRNGMIP